MSGLVKWVVCRAADRAAFHRAQLAWARLRDVPGFLGQRGGWSRRDDSVAHIVGCWADRAAYDAFMNGVHDGIAAGQAGTYTAIEVRLFDGWSAEVADGVRTVAWEPEWTVSPGADTGRTCCGSRPDPTGG